MNKTDLISAGCVGAGVVAWIAAGAANPMLQDYALTLVELGLATALLHRERIIGRPRNFSALRTPTSIWRVWWWGLAAACLTGVAGIATLLLERTRGLIAPGALAPAAAATVKAFVFWLVLAAVFARLGAGRYQARTELGAAFRPVTRPDGFWLVVFGTPLAVALLAVLASLLTGYFLYVAPTVAWSVFFTLLFAGKRRYALAGGRRAR